jgi:hypothetical protein
MMEALRKRLKRIGIFALLAIIAMQLANPSHQNPPVLAGHDLFATNKPPSNIAALLRNSCYDCHSFETKWPWYSYIAPVSWYVARDIKAARANLNFSDWPHDDSGRVRKRWRHIAETVENREMPLDNYTLIHRDAALDDQQRAEIVKWAKGQADSPK